MTGTGRYLFLLAVCAVAALIFPSPARAQIPKLTVSYAEGGAPDLPAFASLSGVSIYATRFALKMIGLNAD
ncbi:MAG: hypothetical protein ACREQK_20595, partial [Candidatus Binatia bacterium]